MYVEKKQIWWLAWLLIACLAITPALVLAQDDEDDEDDDDAPQRGSKEKVIIGQGATEKGAKTAAWLKAMDQYLKDNMMDKADLRAFKDEINTHLKANWKYYADSSNVFDKKHVAKPWSEDTQEVSLRVKLREEKLLTDIKELVNRIRNKMKAMQVIFMSEPSPMKAAKDEPEDRDVLFDKVNEVLNKVCTVVDQQAIQDKIKIDLKTVGASSSADPTTLIWKTFTEVKVVVYLWMATEKKPLYELDIMNPDKKKVIGFQYAATVGTRGIWRQKGEQLWAFQKTAEASPETGTDLLGDKSARKRAIEEASQLAADEICNILLNYSNKLTEEIYTLRFIGFKDSDAMNKVRNSIQSLAKGKLKRYLKIEKGLDGTPNDFSINIKWIPTGEQADVIQVIEESCSANELDIQFVQSVTGMVTFKPKGRK